jgi:hypothetical protein
MSVTTAAWLAVALGAIRPLLVAAVALVAALSLNPDRRGAAVTVLRLLLVNVRTKRASTRPVRGLPAAPLEDGGKYRPRRRRINECLDQALDQRLLLRMTFSRR